MTGTCWNRMSRSKMTGSRGLQVTGSRYSRLGGVVQGTNFTVYVPEQSRTFEEERRHFLFEMRSIIRKQQRKVLETLTAKSDTKLHCWTGWLQVGSLLMRRREKVRPGWSADTITELVKEAEKNTRSHRGLEVKLKESITVQFSKYHIASDLICSYNSLRLVCLPALQNGKKNQNNNNNKKPWAKSDYGDTPRIPDRLYDFGLFICCISDLYNLVKRQGLRASPGSPCSNPS